MRRANVAIAVAEEARAHIDQVIAACRDAGLEHTATLTRIGVVTGSVELGTLPKLRTVAGVLAVELEDDL